MTAASTALGAPTRTTSAHGLPVYKWNTMSLTGVMKAQKNLIRLDWKIITTWQESRWTRLSANTWSISLEEWKAPPPVGIVWHKKHMHWTQRELKQTIAALAHKRTLASAGSSVGSVGSVPGWFVQQAMCVHGHEGDWKTGYNPAGPYYGGLQFSWSTWQSAGGSGDPRNATPAEQIYRAWVRYTADGNSWSEWPNTAHMCGYY